MRIPRPEAFRGKKALRELGGLKTIALILAATSLLAVLGGCAGLVSQNVKGTPPPPTYTISGSISPAAGANGATVVLSGAASATTTANSSGAYSFTGLVDGVYTVTPSRSGYSFAPASLTVTISGASVTTANFTDSAIAQTYTISGTISPTAGGSGATVTLSGAANQTTTANASGVYSFTGLANGSYTVTPSNAGYTFAPANQSVTVSGANVANINFTATAVTQTYSISGTISPTAGGSGATVTLSGAASKSTTANASGVYTFSGLANGSYTVTPSNAGYTFTPASQNATVNGANVANINFTATAVTQTYSISGTISPTAGGSGATLTLSGASNATTTANASGAFTFTGLANGSYTVTPSNAGYTFTPASQNVTVNGANVANINFTATAVTQTYSISGTISPTAGGSGATVTLSGAASKTTTANASGAYTFSGLANGSYTVTPSNTGYTFTPASQNATVNGANVANVNFTASAQPTYSISGTVSPTAGGSGATVTLSGASNATTTANASGVFTFNNLANGSYTVTPSNTGYTFTPANQSVTVSAANVSNINFTAAVQPTYSISGTISPTAGGSGATVSLSGSSVATTSADASGNYAFNSLANGSYIVTPSNTGYTFTPANQSVTVSGANVGNVNFTATVQTSSGKWVEAYYADWQLGQYPQNRIDFTALTHLVLAHWITQTNGTIGSSGWDTSCGPLVTAAHAAGVKVLMMLGGSDDPNYASASSAANLPTLLTSIHSKITNCNLDGVDLDWENNINLTQWVNIASGLKANYPGIIVTVPMDPGDPASYPVAMYPHADRVNMMTYGGGTVQSTCDSWYFSPLQGDTANTCQPSVEKTFKAWTGAGVPASKLGVGIGFYSVGWTAPVTGAMQTTSGSSIPIGEMAYGWSEANGGLLGCYYNKSGVNYQYDPSPAVNTNPSASPQAPSLSIPGGLTDSNCSSHAITWVTYEDEASIAAKAAFANANNMGGAIIWTLSEGATDPVTGRNPLLDAIKLGFLNNGPAPMPLLATQEASVGGATTITLTGLPSNLGQINANWWNGTSGVAWDDKTDTGFATYGQPSEYYIEASPNGTSWTQLTHITGEHYTGRQFVYDFTGTGYTQIRMRIISIVGSNGGNDTFTVHNAANNSTDAYLFLGDSVTANCLTSTPNTFPTEQFGAQVHAQKSARYPVNTVGGQSGWLSGTPLDTTTYGMPAIRQWLNDMPAVKFVTLALGTNDANGNIAPATYYANMKALVQEVIAAGKVPIIPTIVASPSAAVQANAPGLNAEIATLESQYPSIVKGPDLWTLFKGHSVADGWFFDSLHPSLTTGCTAWQNAWVNAMISAEYPQQ